MMDEIIEPDKTIHEYSFSEWYGGQRVPEQKTRPSREDLSRIEKSMRRSVLSTTGMLSDKESLSMRLEADDIFVTQTLGVSHRLLATPLYIVYNAAWNGHFHIKIDDTPYNIGAIAYAGAQDNPFDPNDKSGSMDLCVTNLVTGAQTKNFSSLLPSMIAAYGFYEGDVSYRLPPEVIYNVFEIWKYKDRL